MIVDVGCRQGPRDQLVPLAVPATTAIVGIELDPEVCARTAKRLRKHANVTVLCGDATELLPEDGTVFYLFNPFDEPVLATFAEALLAHGTARDGGSSTTTASSSPRSRATRGSRSTPLEGTRNHALGARLREVALRAARARASRWEPRRRSTITTQVAANASDETNTAAPPPVTPQQLAEDEDQRQQHGDLDRVRDDAQPRPADRDRERLRPAEHRAGSPPRRARTARRRPPACSRRRAAAARARHRAARRAGGSPPSAATSRST